MLAWLQFILCALLMASGVIIIVLSVLGVYRFHFVLNRMHAAAMGDTLGILFIILGLMVATGWSMVLLKLASIILFMWLASPVSSHLITKLEYLTNERLAEQCQFMHLEAAGAAAPEDIRKEDSHGSL